MPSTTPSTVESLSQRRPFEDLTPTQKRRRVHTLNSSFSPEELTSATIKTFKQSGQEEVGNMIEHLMKHPEDIQNLGRALPEKRQLQCTHQKKHKGCWSRLN